MSKRINSRAKGARGERELAGFLTDQGFPAKRGVQFSQGRFGLTESDVVCDSLPLHIECKRVEAGNPYVWLAQAERDAKPGKIPVVFHKRNDHEWIVVLSAEKFIEILRESSLVNE
jgi:Holliday junction resolvase